MKFELNKEQVEKFNKWAKKHKWRPLGTIGGTYTFTFTDTSLGTVVKVKNNANNEEIDISDYDSW